MSTENEKVIHAWVDLLTGKRFNDFFTVWKEDFVLRPGAGFKEARTMEEFVSLAGIFATACPDAKTELLSMSSSGDLVHAHFVSTGTHTGPFMSVPATGKEIKIWTMGVFRIEDGRIAEEWVIDDYASVLAQIGALPE